MTTGDKIKKSVIYILLVLLAAACLFPFLLMMVNATRDGVEITHFFTLIPSTHLKENWETVFSFFNLFRGMANSLLVAVPATLLTAYFSALTAYGLAMYRFRGNKLIFTAILVFMMIPGQLSLIGFYNLCTKLKLVNSYIPLIVPAVAAPGTGFFLRQYILSVMPPALVEAARIDGASELYSFHRIALPIMSPGIATMAIMAFIGNWNNYLLPMIILNKNEKFTLPVMMATLKASTDIQRNQGAIYLAVAISVIPILIVFCFCSKYIISSISAGSVKEYTASRFQNFIFIVLLLERGTFRKRKVLLCVLYASTGEMGKRLFLLEICRKILYDRDRKIFDFTEKNGGLEWVANIKNNGRV